MDAPTPSKSLTVVDSRLIPVARILERFRWHAHLDQQGYSEDRLEHINRVLNLITACGTGWMGSHLYACKQCDRRLLGMNSCNNPHCTNCGQERRDQWREDLLEWSLDCNYFHNVFTLPHELNPLAYCNSGAIYRLLMSISSQVIIEVCRKHFGCTPGTAGVLHTWGQRLNLHLHRHMITTVGGLSLDGTRWITIDDDHPAMQSDYLASEFKCKFMRRLKWMIKRNQLVWPTIDRLPTGYEALGMNSREQMLQFIEQNDVPLPIAAGSKTRELSLIENSFFKHLQKKTWIAHSQSTPPHLQGVKQIINYLSHYVSGNVISDQRIVAVDDHSTTMIIKEYREGDGVKKNFTTDNGDFVRRIAMHILPKHLARVRYSGIFAGCERPKTIPLCRNLIGQLNNARGPELLTDSCGCDESQPFELEEEYIEDEPPLPKRHCRHCQGEMDFIDRLGGTETQSMRRLSEDVVHVVSTELLPVMDTDAIDQLLDQLRGVWLVINLLPFCIRHLFRRGRRLSSIECGALEAFIVEQWRQVEQRRMLEAQSSQQSTDINRSLDTSPRYSGIPPPILASWTLPLERQHAT